MIMATLTKQRQDRPAASGPPGSPDGHRAVWVWVVLGLAIGVVALAIALAPMSGEADEGPADVPEQAEPGTVEQPEPNTGTPTAEELTQRLVNEGYLPPEVLRDGRSPTERLVNEGQIPAGTLP
jgi:hypothetical protein